MDKEEIFTKLKSLKKNDNYIKTYINLFDYFLKQNFKLNKIENPNGKTKDDVVIEYIVNNINYFNKIYTRNNDTNNYIPDTWALINDYFYVDNIKKNRDKIREKIKTNIIKEMKENPTYQKKAKLHKESSEHYYSCEGAMFINNENNNIIEFETGLIKKNKYLPN